MTTVRRRICFSCEMKFDGIGEKLIPTKAALMGSYGCAQSSIIRWSLRENGHGNKFACSGSNLCKAADLNWRPERRLRFRINFVLIEQHSDFRLGWRCKKAWKRALDDFQTLHCTCTLRLQTLFVMYSE